MFDKTAEFASVSPWWAYLVGLGSSAIIWFLAWGLRDVKKRYDSVPDLEVRILIIMNKLKEIERRLNIPQNGDDNA